MSVLEKFLILFESDASDAAKDVEKLDKSLDETEQTANDSVVASDDAGKQFSIMGGKALGAIGGIVALTAAVAGLVMTATKLDELTKFSKLVGEDISLIDAYSGAVVRAGGTNEGFRSSFERLTEQITEAKIKGTGEIIPFLNQLGISVLDADNKVNILGHTLPELRKAFGRLDNDVALGFGKKMGIDTGTILSLQQTEEEFDKLMERQKMLGLVNKEAGQLSEEFVDIMADFKQIMGFTSQTLLVTFIPAMTWTIDKLINLSLWARENKPVIIGLFVGLGTVAIPILVSMASAAWLAVTPLLLIAAPFIAIGAAAAIAGVAIAVVVEDIIAFAKGGNSLIADMEKKWPIVGDIVRFLVDDIKGFLGVMNELAGILLKIFVAPEKALSLLGKGLGVFGSLFGFGGDEQKIALDKNLTIAQDSLSLASNSPIAAQTSNSINNSIKSLSRSVSVKNTGDTFVNTQATDAEGIAGSLVQSQEEQMRSTLEAFDDGIQI